MAATMLGNVVHPSHQVGTARRSCTTPVAFAKKSIVSLPTAKNVMNLIKQRGMDVSVRAVAPTETSGLSKPISPYTGEVCDPSIESRNLTTHSIYIALDPSFTRSFCLSVISNQSLATLHTAARMVCSRRSCRVLLQRCPE